MRLCPEGTASNAQVVGYAIGGKTGTSEKIDEFDEKGRPVDDKIVSFVGVAPIDDPQYIVLVALDTPSPATGYYISGGVMAAPVVRDVFTDILPYLGVTPHYEEEDLHYVNMVMPNVTALSRSEAEKNLTEEHLQAEFVGEKPAFSEANVFDIVKGGSPKEGDAEIMDNKIDAITGATMTSNGLDAAIDTWLGAYAKYFTGAAPACEKACCQEGGEGECEGDKDCENKEVEE